MFVEMGVFAWLILFEVLNEMLNVMDGRNSEMEILVIIVLKYVTRWRTLCHTTSI